MNTKNSISNFTNNFTDVEEQLKCWFNFIYTIFVILFITYSSTILLIILLYLAITINSKAQIEYGNKQMRVDRKIGDYFTHISNDRKDDLACELIIELGDMDF